MNEFLLQLGVGLALFSVAAAMLVIASMIRAAPPRKASRRLPRFVTVFGWAVVGVCTVGALGGLLYHALTWLDGRVSLEQTAALTVCVALLLVIGLGGGFMVVAGRELRQDHSLRDDRRLDRAVGVMQFTGWPILVLGFLTLVTTAVGLGLLVVVALVLLVMGLISVLGSHRRARQASTLWLMSIAVRSNLPLPDEMDAYARSLWGRNRRRVEQFSNRLRQGMEMPEALDVPGLVPRGAVLTTRIGTETGQLADVLRDAAIRQTATLDQSIGAHSVRGSIVYFWSLVLLISFQLGFIMYFIMPKFKKIFQDFNLDLPNITQALIGTSDTVAQYWYLFFPAFVLPSLMLSGLVIGGYYGWDNVSFSWFLGRFPRLDAPPILRNLARVIAARQPVTFGLERMAHYHRREAVRRKLRIAFEDVEAGRDCWDALRRQGYLTKHEVALLHAAERVKNLPWALRELGDTLERRQVRRLLAWSEIMQPVVVILFAMVVAWICLSMFMPLVKVIHELA